MQDTTLPERSHQDKCLMLAPARKRHPETDGSSPTSPVRRLFAGGQAAPRTAAVEPGGAGGKVGPAPDLHRPAGTRGTQPQSGHGQGHRQRFGAFAEPIDCRGRANPETKSLKTNAPEFIFGSCAASSQKGAGDALLANWPTRLAGMVIIMARPRSRT